MLMCPSMRHSNQQSTKPQLHFWRQSLFNSNSYDQVEAADKDKMREFYTFQILFIIDSIIETL